MKPAFFLSAAVLAATLLAPLALSVPARAGTAVRCAEDGDGGACLWGRVEGYDAGSLQIRGLRLALAGIDEPSRKDLCSNKSSGKVFDCGQPARRRIGELLKGGIACDIFDASGGQLHGRCRVADGDLALLLVQSGTVRGKEGFYEAATTEAMTAQRGLWAADMEPPHDWEAFRAKALKKHDKPEKADKAEKPEKGDKTADKDKGTGGETSPVKGPPPQ